MLKRDKTNPNMICTWIPCRDISEGNIQRMLLGDPQFRQLTPSARGKFSDNGRPLVLPLILGGRFQSGFSRLHLRKILVMLRDKWWDFAPIAYVYEVVGQRNSYHGSMMLVLPVPNGLTFKLEGFGLQPEIGAPPELYFKDMQTDISVGRIAITATHKLYELDKMMHRQFRIPSHVPITLINHESNLEINKRRYNSSLIWYCGDFWHYCWFSGNVRRRSAGALLDVGQGAFGQCRRSKRRFIVHLYTLD